MPSQAEKAEAFRVMHHGDRLLVLPNAWDVPSARVFEDAGFPAIATSSAALDVSAGYPDGERIPKEELFPIVARIARVLAVPLSVDLESGFGETTDELTDTIHRLIDAGGVGLNIEDVSHSRGGALRPVEDQVERIRTVRRVSDSLGVPLVVNARTDALDLASGNAKARFDEAVRRAKAYAAGGGRLPLPDGPRGHRIHPGLRPGRRSASERDGAEGHAPGRRAGARGRQTPEPRAVRDVRNHGTLEEGCRRASVAGDLRGAHVQCDHVRRTERTCGAEADLNPHSLVDRGAAWERE